MTSASSPYPAQNRVEALLNELHQELGPELLRTVRPTHSLQSHSKYPEHSPSNNMEAPSRPGSGIKPGEPSIKPGAPLIKPGAPLDPGASLLDSAGQQPHGTRHATGLKEVDAVLGGGFPAGCLSEVSGPLSSGRTSVAFGLLAELTRAGAYVAWVDLADAFDPPSAEAAGVVLDRVLWARAPKTLAALRCTERILETEGFALAVLDLTGQTQSGVGKRNKTKPETISHAVWLRLTRLVAAKQNTLLLLSDERLAGSRAALALEMQPALAHFTGTPALLEGLETRPMLTRRRAGPGPSVQSNTPAVSTGIKVKLKVTSNAA
jgi:hypothetical protein